MYFGAVGLYRSDTLCFLQAWFCRCVLMLKLALFIYSFFARHLKHVMWHTWFGWQVSTKYGTWYGKRVIGLSNAASEQNFPLVPFILRGAVLAFESVNEVFKFDQSDKLEVQSSNFMWGCSSLNFLNIWNFCQLNDSNINRVWNWRDLNERYRAVFFCLSFVFCFAGIEILENLLILYLSAKYRG